MNLPFSGGCLCGGIRYQCYARPLRMHNCHCRDCQRVSGGPCLPVLVVARTAFRVTAGALRHFVTTRMSGRRNLRGFCPRCGSTLTAGEDPERNCIGLAASSVDDPGWFQPRMNIFLCDAQPWAALDALLPGHQHYAPRD